MKKFILSSLLFLSLTVAALAQNITNVNSNMYLVFTDTDTNISFASHEILVSSSPITVNTVTNGAVGYLFLSDPNIHTNQLSTFIPAGTPNGIYYFAARGTDLTGTKSDWSVNLEVNFLNKPSAPSGLTIITLP